MNQALQQGFTTVRQRMSEAASKAGRDPGELRLVAVSKRHPASAVSALAALGQRDFGENYIDEALAKQAEADPQHMLCWHFIGALQSNKTRQAAEHFDWVQTVDRLKIARRLSEQRPDALAPLNILLQVNVSEEASKAGCSRDQVQALAEACADLPRLRLRGLMAIPAALDDHAAQRQQIRPLFALWQQLRQQGHELDTLSVGMTDDLEAAVAEGSTMLRVGTALFGPRP